MRVPIAGETIFAPATATGRAGIAVVRISGPEAFAALKSMAPGAADRPRFAQRLRFVEPVSGEALDDGIAIFFRNPASFTGEDVVELQVHGGRSVVEGFLSVLGKLPGLRLAEPGEFTRRAFENGKIDLTQAEGLADLIDAETEGQRKLAYSQMRGALRERAESWRHRIIEIQGLTEAAIDFSDEGDVAMTAFEQAKRLAKALADELSRHLADRNKGEILRDGFKVAVMGLPNAGKSSLINKLAGRDAVIVSEEAGTTRDVVELHLNLGGIRVVMADTAGVRATTGAVEREGIRRGIDWGKNADLVLWLTEGADLHPPSFLTDENRLDTSKVIQVRTKIDLQDDNPASRAAGSMTGSRSDIFISSHTGAGIDELVAELAERAKSALLTDNGLPLISQARHHEALQDARDQLLAFSSADDRYLELAAEHARRAAFAVGRLTGRVDAEEVLGAIFSRFCIGK